ncbi:uridine kinase [Bacteroidales bacterium OttesenSCG-928-J19]|nr:uridine kinase [Bacteroidales bacterium OttesenSCG-928-J19]
MYVIGMAGGSGSGKTTLVKRILNKLPQERVLQLPQDAYYYDNGHMPLEERKKQNYDHPDSIDWPLMIQHIRDLKAGKTVQMPCYSMLTCLREKETVELKPAKLLIVEGILLYTCPELCREVDLKIFRDVPGDYRLSRIISRDIKSRGRTADQVIERFFETVRPMHEEFIEQSKEEADILLSGGEVDEKAVDFIVGGILHIMGEEK